jgi:Xaa-Pro aminopeptidase/Xaa-Pro dipeptidase
MDKHILLKERLHKLRIFLELKGYDGVMFSAYENRRYFSFFTGSNGYLIITGKECILVTDRRYTTQAKQQTVDCEIIEHAADRLVVVANAILRLGIKKLLMEAGMPVGEYFSLKGKLPEQDFVYEDESFLEMRMVKDEYEIACTKEAIACAERGFDKLLPKLRIGMTEKDMADELHYLVSKEGAEALSFGTIVASGPRGALAHGIPTDRVIEDGDMVVVDFGVVKDGYCSDMTRTLLFGRIGPEKQHVFDVVLEAQTAAFEAIRPGVRAKEVEEAHRQVFRREKLEEYALKGLGHGIGLQIHECPRIVIGNETCLTPNMIFTVEPGLYFPDRYGVRTEDDVLVTEYGYENLSHTSHEIHIR